MQSTSTNDGRYALIITFRVGTDLDLAQVLVQNRVAAALAQLPQSVQQQGVVTKKKSTAILQIVTLTSKSAAYDALYLSNFATLQLRDKLARVPGVGDVTVFGIGQYSMRVWLDPEQMRQRSLMPSDVVSAIQAQNAYVAAGQVGGAARSRGRAVSAHDRRERQPLPGRGVRGHHREELGRADHPGPGRRPGRARRPDLRAVLQDGRPGRGRDRDLPAPRGERARYGRPRANEDDRARPRLPARDWSIRFRSTRRRS